MSRYWLLFTLALPHLAAAQLLFFESSYATLIQPRKPLIADVTLTRKAQTPWGPIVIVEKGKYWRSSKGQIRQDDEFGYSQFVDLREPRRWARVDHELKLISALEDHSPRRRPSYNPARTALSDPKPRKIGETMLDGFKVTVRKGLSNNVETWSSDDLNLPLVVKYSSGTTEFEQRFTNIRIQEPDPSVFLYPDGYRLRTTIVNLPSSGTCLPVTERLTGQPGEKQSGRTFGDRGAC